jgi:hypothetical protein
MRGGARRAAFVRGVFAEGFESVGVSRSLAGADLEISTDSGRIGFSLAGFFRVGKDFAGDPVVVS